MQQKAKTSESHPIQVQFVEGYWGEASKGTLGITFAPGKKQLYAVSGTWHRDLDTDLKRIREHYKIDGVVCLIEPHEFKALQIEDELPACERLGITTYHHPIPDGSITKNQQAFKQLVVKIVDEEIIQNGKRMMVHCMGGLGRAGTFAAACLIYRGVPAEKAIAVIREVRSPQAIETNVQEKFLKNLTFKI